jgi:hypothetical protein
MLKCPAFTHHSDTMLSDWKTCELRTLVQEMSNSDIVNGNGTNKMKEPASPKTGLGEELFRLKTVSLISIIAT